jgi:hypothetical protein
MKRMAVVVVFMTLFAGCAARTTAPSAQTEGTLFRGEVWTWDERTNVVTLRSGTQNTRVRVSPETIRTLRLHDIVVIRGELAPPEQIQHVSTPGGPMRAVPQGSAQQSEVTGTVSAADPKGLVSIDAPQGRVTVWTASTDTSAFAAGTPVRVQITVQPVQMVPASGDAAGATPDPAASVPTTPGDHAVITGRITGIDPKGTITVESPRGPITVAAPNASGLKAGDSVQVRTSLQKAQ